MNVRSWGLGSECLGFSEADVHHRTSERPGFANSGPLLRSADATGIRVGGLKARSRWQRLDTSRPVAVVNYARNWYRRIGDSPTFYAPPSKVGCLMETRSKARPGVSDPMTWKHLKRFSRVHGAYGCGGIYFAGLFQR